MIDKAAAHRLTAKYPLGPRLADNDKMQMYGVKGRPDLEIIVFKDTAVGNGVRVRKSVIPGTGRLAAEIACNVFRLLKTYYLLPVAFKEQDSVTSFVAKKCGMLPCKVVIRRDEPKGGFKQPVVEFVPKTEKCGLSEQEVPKELFPRMTNIARLAFAALEVAWMRKGGTLVSLEVEFGLDSDGNLLLAGAISDSSWRVVSDVHDGEGSDNVVEKYRRIAEITSHFHGASV